MPLLRYFIFVGGGLLALLFGVSAYVPNLPAVEASKSAVAADLSIIRIHSDRKWPERIVFDTSLPTKPPPPNLATPVVAEATPTQKGTAAAPKPPVRESFAQLRANPNEVRNREPKRKRRYLARHDFGPPTIRVAQQPRFGFFGNNIW